nr:uncharacterized protein LOC117853450 [Setaria viridis]
MQGSPRRSDQQAINMAFTDAALRPDGTSTSSTFAGLGVVLDLKVQCISLASDCQQAVSLLQQDYAPTPWRLRPWLSQFQVLRSNTSIQVIKISRQENGAAHCLAAQAKAVTSQSTCSLSCTTQSHVQGCAVLRALQSVSWGQFDLINVLCF